LRPLVTGVTDPETFSSANAAVAFRRVRASGATTAVLTLDWSAVAPSGASPPAGFDASDPGDARYHWAAIDRQVSLAVRTKLDPIIDIVDAPRWAQPRTAKAPYQPDPAAFGDFAHAAALRYSGGYAMLPRVRYWEAWNEPNLTTFLLPQFLDGRPFSPGWYRTMVNAFAAGVHSAARGNVVIAGATAPFADRGVDEVADWGPLTFMRDLLCLSASLQPTCSDKITFDVWSTHPYTSGGPKHHAFRRDDVSLGDLPQDAAHPLGRSARAPHSPDEERTRFLGDRVQLGFESSRSASGAHDDPSAVDSASALCDVAERHHPCHLVHDP